MLGFLLRVHHQRRYQRLEHQSLHASLLKQNVGEILSSINYFLRAYIILPSAEAFIRNFVALLVQFNKKEYKNQLEQVLASSIAQSIELLVLKLIHSIINGEFENVEEKIEKIEKLIPSKEFSELPNEKKRFITAYTRFINKLRKIVCTSPSKPNVKAIYHIGNSHCLTYAHNQISLTKQKMAIKPKIIFGAKAWHFSKPGNNQYKMLLRHHLESTPNGSNIFLSFGEIDCRRDEGIIKILDARASNLLSTISQTVSGYVDFVYEVMDDRDLNLFFLGVHAPLLPVNMETKKLDSSYETQNKIIELFNKELALQTSKKGSHYIDLFYTTKQNDGDFHADEYHLLPSTLDIIERQLNQ